MHWAAVVPTCTWRNYWYTHYILHHGIVHVCVCACGEQCSSAQPPPWSWPAVSCPSPSAQSGGQQCGHPSQPADHHWQTGRPVGTCTAVAHPSYEYGHLHAVSPAPPAVGTGSDMQGAEPLWPLPGTHVMWCLSCATYRCTGDTTCTHTAWGWAHVEMEHCLPHCVHMCRWPGNWYVYSSQPSPLPLSLPLP